MKDLLKRIARNFFSGMLFIVPLVATGYFIFLSLSWIDSLLNLPWPGVGILIILTVITTIGYFTKTYAFETIEGFFDSSINRIPLIKLVYSSLRDLIGAFVGDKKKFDKPVLVRINKDNDLHQIGFITQHDLSELGLNDMVMVYFPHSYAISGFHYLVPKDSVKPLNIPGATAMKFIVSGGISDYKGDN